MKKKIYISGMHSGQNPCSGVGIAKCIRKAFPELTLVGVDHWQGSSGLHDLCVDEVQLLPQWGQINEKRHSQFFRTLLDEGHLWISSLDMEVHWLSEKLGPHKNLFAPGGKALELTAKPTVTALEELGFQVPLFIPASLPDSEIHDFLRHNSWQCWLKSPYHDAQRITSWSAFEKCRSEMAKNWQTSRLFLQRHVAGNEETFAFSAYQGELLSVVHLEKRQITPEGKTWAGRVSPVSPEIFHHFKEAIRRLEWSGGGELEYIHDPDGQKWIIECNPRFPAWIYGAALVGMNLPARLISRAWNLPLMESVSAFPFFTRVVQEIAAKEAVGIPLPQDPGGFLWSTQGKKGMGAAAPPRNLLPKLKDTLDLEEEDEIHSGLVPEQLPTLYFQEIEKTVQLFQGETPVRIHLENWTRSRFGDLARKVRAACSESPEIQIGYSIKTSPTDSHLKTAKNQGFLAECISQMEVRRALDFGYLPREIILNGPGKFWPLTAQPATGLHMVFCDSVEEFDRVLKIPGISKCIGFRMKIPRLNSRFGNSLDNFEILKGL